MPLHFAIRPSNHVKGYGCPECFEEQQSELLKESTRAFIDKSRKIHGDRYDYSQVVYSHNKDKVTIICPEHGAFKQLPQNHLKGCGCIKCAQSERRLTTETFIDRSSKIHKNRYDYSKVDYLNSRRKVVITCPVHGDFEQIPTAHLSGRGCRKCGLETIKVNLTIRNNQ
jgi:hypothetical protein